MLVLSVLGILVLWMLVLRKVGRLLLEKSALGLMVELVSLR